MRQRGAGTRELKSAQFGFVIDALNKPSTQEKSSKKRKIESSTGPNNDRKEDPTKTRVAPYKKAKLAVTQKSTSERPPGLARPASPVPNLPPTSKKAALKPQRSATCQYNEGTALQSLVEIPARAGQTANGKPQATRRAKQKPAAPDATRADEGRVYTSPAPKRGPRRTRKINKPGFYKYPDEDDLPQLEVLSQMRRPRKSKAGTTTTSTTIVVPTISRDQRYIIDTNCSTSEDYTLEIDEREGKETSNREAFPSPMKAGHRMSHTAAEPPRDGQAASRKQKREVVEASRTATSLPKAVSDVTAIKRPKSSAHPTPTQPKSKNRAKRTTASGMGDAPNIHEDKIIGADQETRLPPSLSNGEKQVRGSKMPAATTELTSRMALSARTFNLLPRPRQKNPIIAVDAWEKQDWFEPTVPKTLLQTSNSRLRFRM